MSFVQRSGWKEGLGGAVGGGGCGLRGSVPCYYIEEVVDFILVNNGHLGRAHGTLHRMVEFNTFSGLYGQRWCWRWCWWNFRVCRHLCFPSLCCLHNNKKKKKKKRRCEKTVCAEQLPPMEGFGSSHGRQEYDQTRRRGLTFLFFFCLACPWCGLLGSKVRVSSLTTRHLNTNMALN